MLFATLPTEIRLKILQEFLSHHALPPDIMSLPISHIAMNIYPQQSRFDEALRRSGGVSLRVPKPAHQVQRFWGSTKMAALFTVSRQFAADLSELIYHRASFVLPLSHARHLSQLPPWVQRMPAAIRQSIRNLDVTIEIMRYDTERDPLSALLKECREIRTYFSGVKTLIIRTFTLYSSIEGVFSRTWSPKLLGYLDDVPMLLDIFQGIPNIKLWAREEHSSICQQGGIPHYRGQGTWMSFKLKGQQYLAEDGRKAASPSELFSPAAIREAHAWIYPVPMYPMMKVVDGRCVWNIGIESDWSV